MSGFVKGCRAPAEDGWWRRLASAGRQVSGDETAELIEEGTAALIKEKKISLPRGGYLLTRGRGRVIVTRTAKN